MVSGSRNRSLTRHTRIHESRAGGGDREIDGRSDIYSLACVLYEMLAGDPPFVASNPRALLAKHVTDPAPPITTVRSSVPQPVAAAIAKALGKARADRFETAKVFAEALCHKPRKSSRV